MIGATGIWSDEEQSAHIFSYGVARWVAKNVDGLIYDFGAGNCTYSTYFHEVWKLVVSIDGFPHPALKVRQDLTIDFDLGVKGNVLCLEVFEHVPVQYESVLVDNIVRHCSGKLIISVAHEGQQGLGHVNTRPGWYVKELFQSKGFKFMEEETESIRSCAEGYVAYLRENLFVFEKT
jgi:hypothetical protein